MCTSYLLTVSEDFPGYFDVSHGLPRDFLNQEFVAFPGSMMPVVTRNSPNKVEMMQWGLIPSWSKDIKLGKKLFNARSETLLEKPLFRSALLNHCIIPANSFYEWSGEEGHKTKINFSPKKEAYLYIAGIYDTWIDAEKNEHKTYTMITREALSTVGKYHNRQPLMLSREEMELWLSKDTTLDQLKRLLKGTQTPTLDVDDTPKGESTQSLL